jgi:hypothetical protein
MSINHREGHVEEKVKSCQGIVGPGKKSSNKDPADQQMARNLAGSEHRKNKLHIDIPGRYSQ